MRTTMVAVLALAIASETLAQHPLLEQGLTERGLAAYSAGNTADAVELFTASTHVDAADPWPHYLRALCLMKMGRSAEARAELLAGAQLEAQNPSAYPVEAALRNLVGADRKLIDAIRYRAMIGEPLVASTIDRSNIAGNAAVLRQRVALSLGDLVRPVSLAEALQRAPKPPTQTRISATVASPSNLSESPAAAETSAEELPDPFADDPVPAAGAETSDAFAPPAASGAERSETESTAVGPRGADEPAGSSEPTDGEDEDPFAGP